MISFSILLKNIENAVVEIIKKLISSLLQGLLFKWALSMILCISLNSQNIHLYRSKTKNNGPVLLSITILV